MIREQIINAALAELGTKENPPNSNITKYGAWYGLNGVSWCAIFVSWVYSKAGYPLGHVDTDNGYQYCPSAYNYWKASGEITAEPQPGDIVLYDWDGDGFCDHTGIFNAWVEVGKVFTAIEGNTSVGNDSDGGQVMQRTRSCALVRAFVSPKVLGTEVSAIKTDFSLSAGTVSADVVELQKALYKLKYAVTVDGNFGPRTLAAVNKFQQDMSLPVTPVVSQALLGAIVHASVKQPAPVAKITTGSYLQTGSSGSAVVALQNALNQNGANPILTVDGVFKAETKAALIAFQTVKGLKPDGIAGPETFTALGLNTA